MKTEVRYVSVSGNTKKIADAIAEELGIEAKTIDAKISPDTDVLFLGSSLHSMKLDDSILNFIHSEEIKNAKKVFCFSTTSIMDSTYRAMIIELGKAGIVPQELEYHCRGKMGALHFEHPDKYDIKRAKSFAKRAIKII